MLASIAFSLTRAAGCLASPFHARATTGTIRAQFINSPARPLRPHAPAASANQLALGTSVDATVRRNLGTPRIRLNPVHRREAKPRPDVEEPDRPADHPRPTCDQDHQEPSRPSQASGRWIQAQKGASEDRSHATFREGPQDGERCSALVGGSVACAGSVSDRERPDHGGPMSMEFGLRRLGAYPERITS